MYVCVWVNKITLSLLNRNGIQIIIFFFIHVHVYVLLFSWNFIFCGKVFVTLEIITSLIFLLNSILTKKKIGHSPYWHWHWYDYNHHLARKYFVGISAISRLSSKKKSQNHDYLIFDKMSRSIEFFVPSIWTYVNFRKNSFAMSVIR